MQQKNQQGITVLSLLTVGILVVIVAVVGMRVVPAYINYMQVVSAVDSLKHTDLLENQSANLVNTLAVRRKLINQLYINGVKEVKSKDINFVRENNALTVQVKYDVVVKIAGNFYILIKFKHHTILTGKHAKI